MHAWCVTTVNLWYSFDGGTLHHVNRDGHAACSPDIVRRAKMDDHDHGRPMGQLPKDAMLCSECGISATRPPSPWATPRQEQHLAHALMAHLDAPSPSGLTAPPLFPHDDD